MRVALTGDLLVTRRLRGAIDGGKLAPLTALLAEADAAVGNLETLLHSFSSPASAASGGTWLQAEPGVAEDLRALGFDLVARANNHALDYGVAALEETTRNLDRAGLGHAGAGQNLDEALSPAVLDTACGRVALLSVCSSLPLGTNATRSRGVIPGRAGIAPLRFHRSYTVPAGTFHGLREVAKECLLDQRNDSDVVTIGELSFRCGSGYGVSSEPDDEDLAAVVRAVGEARRVADVVLVSVHSHESDDDPTWESPPQFLRAALHRIAEAGAFAVFGHGPHILRGVEVHQGVPILYSLGNLFFQNDAVAAYPDDARRAYGPPPYPSHADADADVEARKLRIPGYDFRAAERFGETAVAVLTGDGSGCDELTLVPFVLSRSDTLGERGLPRQVDDAASAALLDRLVRLSAGLGSKLQLDDGRARLRLRS